MWSRQSRGAIGVAVLAVAGVALVALAGTRGEAQQKREPFTVTQLECPLGCGAIEGYTIYGSYVAKEHPWLVFQVQETPGYAYNIREMARNKKRWKNTTFGTEDTIIQIVFHGGAPELKEFYPEQIKIRWKALYGLFWPGQGMWYITFDPNLKTIADLKGKRVGLGLRGQSDWGADARIFLETGYGITPKNTDLRHLGPVAASEAMLDGKVDAVVMGIGVAPGTDKMMLAAPYRLLEASGRKLYYIGMDKEAVDRVNKRYGTTYQTWVVPRGKLKDQDQDLLMGVDRAFAAAHPDFPEDVAYEMVKTIAGARERLQKVHPFFALFGPNTMVNGLSEENTHPGALRALKEMGYWALPRGVPMTYPE